MRKLLYISIFILVQQNIWAQVNLVGKIEYYKSYEHKDSFIESYSDDGIKSLNSRKHKLLIGQGTNRIQTQTDSIGFFNFILNDDEKIMVEVSKRTSLLYHRFTIEPEEIKEKDTIILRISDRKLSLGIDSIQAPKFFMKYNEKQAEKDFKNGNARILSSGAWITDKIAERRKKISEKYNFKYKNIFGCLNSKAEKRIGYRYNEKMKKLIGIKENVW